MTTLYDTTAKKKTTSLTINSELLKVAKEYKINLSKLLEENLQKEIKQQQAKAWQENNQEAIEEQNRRVEKNGLFSDSIRSF